MKRILVVLLIASTMIFAGDFKPEKSIIKKFLLTQSVNTVYRTWGKPVDKTAAYFWYNTKLAGYSCQKIVYHFKNKVNMTAFLFKSNDSITEFLAVKKLIDTKYGALQYKLHWSNDLYKDDTKYWEMAIKLGHLTVYHTATFGNVTIIHKLYGQNYSMYHVLIYMYNPLRNEHLKYLRNKNKNDL